MQPPTIPNENQQIHQGGPPPDGPQKEAILRELESILSSPFFRTSNRSKQFLSYVVQHTLDGSHEPLKERTIGAKLFQRPAGYSTGDDPVVRVQAGEVRRRLEQYHHAAVNHSPVRIELPVGSYALNSGGFRLRQTTRNLRERNRPQESQRRKNPPKQPCLQLQKRNRRRKVETW
jgi:hypothetical protein